MVNRLFNPLIVRFAALAALLALALVLAAPVAFAQDSSINYPENGTDPVATYTASDQDEDAIVWSLAETGDYKLFTIDGGVLAFKKSPDYEKPGTALGGTIADRNVYNVTIKATGGSHAVAVTVTNVDEDGKVSINKPQPQVGRGLEASLSDEDGGVSDEEWQWARSEDGETWADIEGATSQSRSPASADVGSYLRATVTYTDLFDSGKMVSAVTNSRVEARTVANAAPSFEDQDETAADVDDDTTEDGDQDLVIVNRSVNENAGKGSAVGKPVSATDSDSDVLSYTLEDGDLNDQGQHVNNDSATDTDGMATPSSRDGDSRHFTVDSGTGQIKIDVEDGLNFEAPGSIATSNSYVVRVIATDPSGASKAQEVTITVTNVHEAPTFAPTAPKTIWVTERDDAKQLRTTKADADGAADNLPADAYEAPDNDNTDGTTVDAITYELVDNDDDEFFSIVEDSGLLTVAADHAPNYEKQGSYSLTIVATSGADDRRRTARLDVTVNVVDAEDPGVVSLSQREPQVGQTVIATVTDPDGGVTVLEWEWARVALVGTNCPTAEFAPTPADDIIEDASSAAYTPVLADRDMCLQARVTYTDNIAGDGEAGTGIDQDDDADNNNMDGVYASKTTEKDVQVSDPANTAPLFPDQDPSTSGDQSDETSRSIAENTKADQSIGAPVTAGDSNGDLLQFTMSGPDADSFKISKTNGQLTTKAALDYETKNMYQVVVNATDPSGAQDSILVTINVTDEDDAATITPVTGPVEPEEPENNAPEFAAATAARSVDENEAAGMPVGAPVTATDADDDDLAYSLSGSTYFDIDDSGQITTTMMLDHEDMASHEVTVTADDGNGGSDSITVTIAVGDVDLGGIADSYDANNDEMIDRDEASAAITDYLLHGTISQDEARAVVRAYLASP